jgi:5-methyltetrahydropteroyltriglutamate--homocysteine methyltransferase
MKAEYDEIHRAALVLQLDCPDLAMTRHMNSDESLEDFRRRAKLHVEAINHATRDIPGDDMRMHLCWGNYEGPHHHDMPLRDIIDIVFEARPTNRPLRAARRARERDCGQ